MDYAKHLTRVKIIGDRDQLFALFIGGADNRMIIQRISDRHKDIEAYKKMLKRKDEIMSYSCYLIAKA